jgi:hypothetical protein
VGLQNGVSLNDGNSSFLALPSPPRLGDDKVSLNFQLGFNYPSFWSPRIIITGKSIVTYTPSSDCGVKVVSQEDVLDMDLTACIQDQILPKFWDLYHLNMAPPAEVRPVVKVGGVNPFKGYEVYESPKALVVQHEVWDDLGREGKTASSLPQGMFSTNIKTVGPKKDLDYVTGSGVEVEIGREGGRGWIKWEVEVGSAVMSNLAEGLKVGDGVVGGAVKSGSKARVREARVYASRAFQGDPQDRGVGKVREELFERCRRDGLKAKVGEDGRPKFFYRYGTAKTCWVEDGLGMVVWEWRLKGFRGHEVCMELEGT